MKRLNNVPQLKQRRVELRKNQTPQETILWAQLRQHRLGFKFKRQHSIGPYILDFYCPDRKLAIELDGSQHLENKQYDNERTVYMSDFGIRIIRFWNNEVNTDIVGVMESISKQLNDPLRPAKGEVSGGRRG